VRYFSTLCRVFQTSITSVLHHVRCVSFLICTWHKFGEIPCLFTYLSVDGYFIVRCARHSLRPPIPLYSVNLMVRHKNGFVFALLPFRCGDFFYISPEFETWHKSIIYEHPCHHLNSPLLFALDQLQLGICLNPKITVKRRENHAKESTSSASCDGHYEQWVWIFREL